MLARKSGEWYPERTTVYKSLEHVPERGQFAQWSPALRLLMRVVPVVIVFGCILMALYQRTVYLGYEAVRMQNEIIRLANANDRLTLEVAEMKSPVRVQRIARDTLGMVLPDMFLYSSKGTKTETVQATSGPIVD